MNSSEAKKEIAILGGGVGGLTAAFELTATPELRARHSVTVYQLGWRLGGKGASGRNAAHNNRIEEHGLHVWFGFYDNAFRLMRDAYEELGREPGTPLATFDDAFKPCNQLVLYDRQGSGWVGLPFDCPTNQMSPGDADALPTFWEIAAEACGWALMGWRGLREAGLVDVDGDVDIPFVPEWFEDLAGERRRGPAGPADRRRRAAARGGRAARAGARRQHRPPAAAPGRATGPARAAPEELPRLALDRCASAPATTSRTCASSSRPSTPACRRSRASSRTACSSTAST